ncbi:uncharacterized protein LOC122973509 isoform X3 [Thunnus albacares]|uniref:uncharacterized protein LOC122973509 isoform X3 n=1 Tax=Thunnus albacares TaxID=8236 RepID=UPI001CF6E4B3|nr:uncharacterized protein LOC122973509 isoform X3 [Thunnus albacares]
MASKRTKRKRDAKHLKSDSTSEEKKKKEEKEKCYDPEDSTLKFVDREDEMDFLCIGYKSRRALMSCGHAVTPMSLTDWCRHLLDQEVCKMALLTPEEMREFGKKMFNNSQDVKSCPGCKSRVMRADLNDLSVLCSVCTADKKKVYRFCCQCSREWKGPFPRSDRCKNDGCINLQVETLRKCPEIIFKDVKDVTGCPSIRACPTCGQLVEHNTKLCKSIICRRCKVKFCFVCLNLFEGCRRTSLIYGPCLSGVAPRQTSIPVWKLR